MWWVAVSYSLVDDPELDPDPEPVPMFGQFAWPVPDGAPGGAVAVDGTSAVLDFGVVVVLLVAALAATAPPATSAPETARTAAA